MGKYSLENYGEYKKRLEAYSSIKARRRAAGKAYDDLVESVRKLEADFTKALTETAEGNGNIEHETNLKSEFNLKKVEIQTMTMELLQLSNAEELAELKLDQASESTHQAAIADAMKDFKPVFKKIIENLRENNRLHRQVYAIYNELAASGIPGSKITSVGILMLCSTKLDPGGDDDTGAILPALVQWAKEKGIYE
jgi:Cdc6-like AAA superfamily ATPase